MPIFNPEGLLSYNDDFQHPLTFKFYIEDFNLLIRTVCDSIEQVFPNQRLLMNFWQIKNSEKPGKSSLFYFDENRDSYDRCDYYNDYGVSVFFILKLRKAFFQHMGLSAPAWEGFDLTSDLGLNFTLPYGTDFILEMM